MDIDAYLCHPTKTLSAPLKNENMKKSTSARLIHSFYICVLAILNYLQIFVWGGTKALPPFDYQARTPRLRVFFRVMKNNGRLQTFLNPLSSIPHHDSLKIVVSRNVRHAGYFLLAPLSPTTARFSGVC